MSRLLNSPHILFNGLCFAGGGTYIVGREMLKVLTHIRPNWRFTLVVSEYPVFKARMDWSDLPDNCVIKWTPSETGRLLLARKRYERGPLSRWADDNDIDLVHQPNGMIIPTMKPPSHCHFQDPWPYRTEAQGGFRDHALAWLKRRGNARALRRAALSSWTSAYLRELVCGHCGITPEHDLILHNGIPEEWIARAENKLPSWNDRPLEIATISTVRVYKRQHLVIEALARLRERPGLENLKYRILGICDPDQENRLRTLAKSLKVEDKVIIEGRVSDERVQEVFQQTRCYVLMSVCESFGIPAIEAMSFGTPVITSDCCAMPEVCGKAGALVEVDNVEKLTDRIEQVLLQPDEAERMRHMGLENIKRFNWRNIVERMAEAMEETLDRTAR